MKDIRLTSVYFSPTGGTRRAARAFAEGFGGTCTENDITLPAMRARELQDIAAAGDAQACGDPSQSLALLAGPVYGGRSFKLLTKTIASLCGQGRPAVLLCTYGGRHYDLALADLYEAAVSAGFVPVACAAIVSEHSFSSRIQAGRPDEADLQLVGAFGRKIREKLEDGLLQPMPPEAVPQRPVDLSAIGMHRERLGRLSPNRPFPSDACLHCGTCASVCPLGLIDSQDSDRIVEKCIKCNACVKACPAGAMQFPQEDFKAVAENCEQTFGREERSSQVWLG